MFAANDNLAQQAINALEAAGVGPVPLSGQDATAAGIQNILLGEQTMTVYKPIEAEAAVAAEVALALRAGEDVSDHRVRVRVLAHRHQRRAAADRLGRRRRRRAVLRPDARSAVTVDNIADTVIADGFRTIEEICAGDIAETDFCQENA